MKCCGKCKLYKDESEFHRGAQNPDGLQYDCKACRSEAAKFRYLTNLNRIKQSTSEWKSKNLSKIQARRRFKKYSMLPGQFAQILDLQGGRCAICKTEMANPHIDHNHQTGEIRGLLCKNCNWLLGHAKESVEILLGAVTYLRKTEKQETKKEKS